MTEDVEMSKEEESWHAAIRKFAASYNKNSVGYFESLAEIYEEVDPFPSPLCSRKRQILEKKRRKRKTLAVAECVKIEEMETRQQEK